PYPPDAREPRAPSCPHTPAGRRPETAGRSSRVRLPRDEPAQPVAGLDERGILVAVHDGRLRPVGGRVRPQEDDLGAEALESEQGVGDALVENVPLKVDDE